MFITTHFSRASVFGTNFESHPPTALRSAFPFVFGFAVPLPVVLVVFGLAGAAGEGEAETGEPVLALGAVLVPARVSCVSKNDIEESFPLHAMSLITRCVDA